MRSEMMHCTCWWCFSQHSNPPTCSNTYTTQKTYTQPSPDKHTGHISLCSFRVGGWGVFKHKFFTSATYLSWQMPQWAKERQVLIDRYEKNTPKSVACTPDKNVNPFPYTNPKKKGTEVALQSVNETHGYLKRQKQNRCCFPFPLSHVKFLLSYIIYVLCFI